MVEDRMGVYMEFMRVCVSYRMGIGVLKIHRKEEIFSGSGD